MIFCTESGGKQCTTKDELTSMKRQLASLQSVIKYLLELSIQYHLNHVSGM